VSESFSVYRIQQLGLLQSSPCVVPVLLPIVWPPVDSRLAPVLVSVAVVVGAPVATRMTPVTTEI